MPSKPFWPPMTLRVYALPCHSSAANLAHLSTVLSTINATPPGQLPPAHPDYLPPDLFAVLPGQPQKGRRYHDTQARVVFKDAVQSILPHISACAAAAPLPEEFGSLAPVEMMERLRRRLASHGLESTWASAPTDRGHWARAFFEHAGPAPAPTHKDVFAAAKAHFRAHGIVLEDVIGDFARGERRPAPNLFFIFASPLHATHATQLGAFDLHIGSATWSLRLTEYRAIPAANPFTMAVEAGSGALAFVRCEVEAMLAEFNRFAKPPSKLVLCDTPLDGETWVRVAVDSFAACRHLLDKFVLGPASCKLELVYDLNERRLKPPKPELGKRKRDLDLDLDLDRPFASLDVLMKLAAEQSRATAALVAHQSQITAAFIATLAHIREHHQSLSTAWVVYTATLSGLNGDLMRVEGNIERYENEISNLHEHIAMYSAAGEMGEAWDVMIQNARDQLAHSEEALHLAQGELEAIKKRKQEVEGDKPAPLRPLVLPPVLAPSQIEEVDE